MDVAGKGLGGEGVGAQYRGLGPGGEGGGT